MPTGIAQKFFCQKEIQLGLFFDGTGNNKDTDRIKTKIHLKRLNIDNYDSQQLQKNYQLFKQCSEVVFII